MSAAIPAGAAPLADLPSTMLAARLVAADRFELERRPVPRPGEGELLLRVDAALTCGTDLKTLRRGHPRLPLPAPMGHEAAGTVAAVGSGVRRFRTGDAVVFVPTAPCGVCRLCRRGRENLCPDAVGRMVLGAFAEYLLLPRHVVRRHVFPRPDGLAAREAAALEPLACVVHGARRLDLERAETVALVGDGAIALLFVQVARALGAPRILVAGRHPHRLAVAAELGADRTIEVPEGDEARLRAAVSRETGGAGADVVVECVGTPRTWELASSLAAAGGEVLLFGGCAAGTHARFDTERLHYGEVDHSAAFHYAPADVADALDLLARGTVRAAPLVTHARPLSELDDAIHLALSRAAIKVAILPGRDPDAAP